MLVIAVHTAQASVAWSGIGRDLINQGARGVQLFFVASALTLLISWNSKQDGIGKFYLRRIFRIAPMFWIGIVFFTWLNGFRPTYFSPHGISMSDIGLTVIFVNGWHPELITSVVDGGWSIAVEMMFYLIFPLIATIIRGWVSGALLLVGSIFAADQALQYFWLHRSLFWPGVSDDLVSTFLNLWFPSQFPVFTVGFLLYFAVRDLTGRLSEIGKNFLLCMSMLGMVLLGMHGQPIHLLGLVINIQTSFAVCFGVFSFALSDGAGKILVNTVVAHIGKVSFSAYLWHFAILGLLNLWASLGIDPLRLRLGEHGFGYFCLFYPLMVVVTVLASSLTYRWIEKPMIAVGTKFINKLDGRYCRRLT